MRSSVLAVFPLLVALTSVACPEADPEEEATATPPAAPMGSTGQPYDMGNPVVMELYVSPSGADGNSGESLGSPLQTLQEAWSRIPSGTLSGTGYRINLVEGSYPCGAQETTDCVNAFGEREGTFDYPIILRSVDGAGQEKAGAAIIRGGLDFNRVSYLYLIGLELQAGGELPLNNSGNNVLHLASADHILMRGLSLIGPEGRTDTSSNIQEVLKINQGTSIFLESSELVGTFQTVLDYFSVQGGHILNNRIHGSGGRCAYLKGGSAFFRVEGNEFWDCHEAGFQAGEGSTLNLMQSPYIQYEAYDIKVINNLIHDIYGAGFSVSGAYNTLFAYNTLYRIGLSDSRDWTLAQLVLGSRTCAIVDEYPSAEEASARCQSLLDEGGWGTALAGHGDTGGEWIPNKNTFVYNNIFYNPTGTSTAYAHLAVNGALSLPEDAQNIPDPAASDENLRFAGNMIWNGSLSELYSSTNGSTPGCAAGHPTCNPDQVRADNAINAVEPLLTDPVAGDFSPAEAGAVQSFEAVAIPAFTWDEFTPALPEGNLENEVPENRLGEARNGWGHPGAY